MRRKTDQTSWRGSAAHRLLATVCLVLAVHVAGGGLNARPGEDGELSAAPEAIPGTGVMDFPVPRGRDFSRYAATFASRNLFRPPSPVGETAARREAEPADTRPDLGARYHLVGILLEAEPLAVIEDREEQRTLFVSPGDRIGPARVETIEPGRVVLTVRGRESELKL